MILCSFHNTDPWFNACFKFITCMTYSAFCFFQFSFFQVKRVNHCTGYVNFQDIEHQLQEIVFHHFHHYSFL